MSDTPGAATVQAEPIAANPPASPRPRRNPIGSGKPGAVRAKLRAALAEARAGNRMTVEHEVRAVLAERYAAIVDRAASAGDGRELLAAGDKLLELLDTLPIRTGGGGGEGDGGTPRGKLLTILDRGPSVGDSANA